MKPLMIAAVVVSMLCGVPVASADYSAQIQSLLELPAKERRAKLKAMPKEERRGLWFQLKAAERAKKGGQAKAIKADGSYARAVSTSKGSNTGGGGKAAKKAKGAGQGGKAKAAKALGTIVYDNGYPTIGFGGGAIIGNRFNTNTGVPIVNPGTVSTIRAQVVPGPANTTSSAGFVLLGPQTAPGGAAMAIFSSFTPASGVVDDLVFSGLGVTYTGSSFFVLFGDFANSYVPVFGTGTTNGQGHHGLVGYTGGMGPNIVSTFNFGGALNAYIRASGNVVPVELTNFSVK